MIINGRRALVVELTACERRPKRRRRREREGESCPNHLLSGCELAGRRRRRPSKARTSSPNKAAGEQSSEQSSLDHILSLSLSPKLSWHVATGGPVRGASQQIIRRPPPLVGVSATMQPPTGPGDIWAFNRLACPHQHGPGEFIQLLAEAPKPLDHWLPPVALSILGPAPTT